QQLERGPLRVRPRGAGLPGPGRAGGGLWHRPLPAPGPGGRAPGRPDAGPHPAHRPAAVPGQGGHGHHGHAHRPRLGRSRGHRHHRRRAGSGTGHPFLPPRAAGLGPPHRPPRAGRARGQAAPGFRRAAERRIPAKEDGPMTQAAASQSAGTATHGLFINDQWTPAKTGRTFAVTDPATGETLATVADAGREDTRAAIEAAHAAFPAWSRTPAMARGRILRHVAALMRERKDTLARPLTREMGKPLTEARGEIEYAASFLDWFAGEGERVYGDIIPQAVPGKRHLVLKQPVCVVAAITPWNFPAAMVTRKVAPALAAGCTVVLKPAEQTPLT